MNRLRCSRWPALALLAALLPHPACAEQPSPDAAPLIGPRPVFVPGLYETESRNSAFKTMGEAGAAKSRTCLASADYEAFRRETLAQYEGNPQFLKACKLSDSRDLPDGFAFAMDCKESKIVLAFHFAKDRVTSTNQTLFPRQRALSSEILTLSQRVGECEGQAKPGRGT
jgi:hypothetical protein